MTARTCLPLLATIAACADDPAPGRLSVLVDDGAFTATCPWVDCQPDVDYLTYDDGLVQIYLQFRADELFLAEAYIDDYYLADDGFSSCGWMMEAAQVDVDEGRLHGWIEATVHRCRLIEGDILDDTGIDPVPYRVIFDLATP